MTVPEIIYREYRDKVCVYFKKRVNSDATAEDLCSDVFLKVVQKIESFDENKSSISTWLYTIARNTLYDYFRTNREICELDETVPAEDDFAERLCTEEMLGRLAAALETLPLREREILIRCYYHGQTLTDIAKIMGISKSYVFILRNAALEKLKGYFEI